jgi:hypothetical protein
MEWLVSNLRGWLLTPIRVVDDFHFLKECLGTLNQDPRQQQQQQQQQQVLATVSSMQ